LIFVARALQRDRAVGMGKDEVVLHLKWMELMIMQEALNSQLVSLILRP